jgi:hypothetical protein
MGKLARGSVGAMGDRRWRPTAASSSPDWRNERGGVRGYGALCRRRKSTNESGRSWRRSWTEEKKPRGVARVLAMAAAGWRPGSAPSGRGTHRDSQQRGGERREGVGATRGGEGKQEVVRQQQHSGGRGVLCAGGREEQRVPEEEEEKRGGGGPKDLFAKTGKSRDSTVK